MMAVGCATTARPAHGPRYSADEVERAQQDAEQSALTRMGDSVDLETAQAAHRVAAGETR